MSLRLAPGAHWGVAYLCLQPGPRLRPPLAPLHAPPTTPGCSPGSAHHPWLLPRLCPPSRLLPSPRPPHLAPPQALPIVLGSSPSPAHLPRPRPLPQTPPTAPGSLSRPRPLPQAPLQAPPTARSALSRARCTSGRRSHSAALLLAHVAGTGPSTAVPETRPDGLVWWPGHRALTEAEFSANTQSTGKSGRCEAAGGPATQRSWWPGGQRARMPAAVCARGRAWAGPFRPGPRLASGTRGHALPPPDHARAARWPWP